MHVWLVSVCHCNGFSFSSSLPLNGEKHALPTEDSMPSQERERWPPFRWIFFLYSLVVVYLLDEDCLKDHSSWKVIKGYLQEQGIDYDPTFIICILTIFVTDVRHCDRIHPYRCMTPRCTPISKRWTLHTYSYVMLLKEMLGRRMQASTFFLFLLFWSFLFSIACTSLLFHCFVTFVQEYQQKGKAGGSCMLFVGFMSTKYLVSCRDPSSGLVKTLGSRGNF